MRWFKGRWFAGRWFRGRWFAGATALVVPAEAGGVFQRRDKLSRHFRSFPRMSRIQYDTLPQDTSETVLYVFDFSRFPEIVGGETLSAPEIDEPDPTGLTLGAPVVTTVDRVVDEHGTTVPAGQGVEIAITGGVAGTTYALECRATTSGGSVRVVKGAIAVE